MLMTMDRRSKSMKAQPIFFFKSVAEHVETLVRNNYRNYTPGKLHDDLFKKYNNNNLD